jgi:hypothetical protein
VSSFENFCKILGRWIPNYLIIGPRLKKIRSKKKPTQATLINSHIFSFLKEKERERERCLTDAVNCRGLSKKIITDRDRETVDRYPFKKEISTW